MAGQKAIYLMLAALLLKGCGIADEEREDESSVSVITQQTTVTTAAIMPETEPLPEYLFPDAIAEMPAESLLQPEQIDPAMTTDYFSALPLSDEIFARMNGVSFHENPNITRDSLRYLRVLHYNPAGEIRTGEMICNQLIASDLLAIFQKLYEAQYPIGRMVLVDDYAADDGASMAANNTSCFNYRVIAGSTTLSVHAKGLAVDINPQFNPYVTFNADGTANIEPENGRAYANRENFFPMKIDHDDLCYQLFTEHGFTWGGDWNSPKDYQHFEWNADT